MVSHGSDDSSGIPINHHVGGNIFGDNRPCTHNCSRTDPNSVNDDCADGNPSPFFNSHTATQTRTRPDVRAIVDHAFMVHAGTGIDNAVTTNSCSRIDYGSSCDHGACSDLYLVRNNSSGVDGRRKLKTNFFHKRRHIQPSPTVAKAKYEMGYPRLEQSAKLFFASQHFQPTNLLAVKSEIKVVNHAGDFKAAFQPHDIGHDKCVARRSPNDCLLHRFGCSCFASGCKSGAV